MRRRDAVAILATVMMMMGKAWGQQTAPAARVSEAAPVRAEAEARRRAATVAASTATTAPSASAASEESSPSGSASPGSAGMTKATEASPRPRPAAAAQPQPIQFHLVDGSVISGEFGIDHLVVHTEFGDLTIPAARVQRLVPGLDSHPETGRRLKELVAQLADPDVARRDEAQRELVRMGLPFQEQIRRHAADPDPERQLRIKAILDELVQRRDEALGEGEEAAIEPVVAHDQLGTEHFTVAGDIDPDSFPVKSAYGTLKVSLADITMAQRVQTIEQEEISRLVAVGGVDIMPSKPKSTGIRLERGDRVTLKAEGQITMTPWGSNAVSTPEGMANYGWFVSEQIPMGALVGRVGAAGTIFKVGVTHRFTADRAGMLYLGLGIQGSYGNRPFPGEYKVRVRVERSGSGE